MHSRDDMVNMERNERLGILRETAILATIKGPPPNASSCGGIHQPFVCFARTARALACKRLMTSMAST